ncbi:hypothetical protein CABS01_06185 [Colletotrichum abscissum]|uniref:uncharacterized protein n=1 Tax=Colletotrichum abscissum TaxID=1671311 RepID=UPI0027D4FD43|nr:uncharacterized protein CABS01_06185 [Colletotrichum abscissum]KAK1516218.1 hypothetical protein CABS01_06185 [Colletotrichum abscissum]
MVCGLGKQEPPVDSRLGGWILERWEGATPGVLVIHQTRKEQMGGDVWGSTTQQLFPIFL